MNNLVKNNLKKKFRENTHNSEVRAVYHIAWLGSARMGSEVYINLNVLYIAWGGRLIPT